MTLQISINNFERSYGKCSLIRTDDISLKRERCVTCFLTPRLILQRPKASNRPLASGYSSPSQIPCPHFSPTCPMHHYLLTCSFVKRMHCKVQGHSYLKNVGGGMREEISDPWSSSEAFQGAGAGKVDRFKERGPLKIVQLWVFSSRPQHHSNSFQVRLSVTTTLTSSSKIAIISHF